ncbi:hypothetical protein [Erwinia sp. 9145]|uniref:hypothetical protein n=1 Tax=Erwinia sp. 9145 TaxID=1500895 RepID=UPI001E446978|nr:hypothetical protein [Erwinia sp. 9145]
MKRTPDEFSISWRMWIVMFATSFGIYLGGVTSGYFIARAEYSQYALKRDATVNEIKRRVEQLPQRTAEAVKEDEAK